MMLLLNIFIVFSLTLLVTKSKILAGKREFVELRYEASKVNDQKPSWFHRIWHAIFTCPMCSGFWFALPICVFNPAYGLIIDVLVIFGANWLLHCIENILFFAGKIAEDISEYDFEEHFEAKKKFYICFSNSRKNRLIEKFLENFVDRQ